MQLTPCKHVTATLFVPSQAALSLKLFLHNEDVRSLSCLKPHVFDPRVYPSRRGLSLMRPRGIGGGVDRGGDPVRCCSDPGAISVFWGNIMDHSEPEGVEVSRASARMLKDSRMAMHCRIATPRVDGPESTSHVTLNSKELEESGRL